MRRQVEMRLLELDVRHRLRALDDLHRLLAGHAPLGAIALLLQRARPVHGDARAARAAARDRASGGCRYRRPMPSSRHIASMRSSSSMASMLMQRPFCDRHLQLFVLLVGAVEDERLRVGAGEQRQVHLVDAEAVAAGALLVHDVADGEAVVRLVGEQDLDIRIVPAERVAELRGRCSGAGSPR